MLNTTSLLSAAGHQSSCDDTSMHVCMYLSVNKQVTQWEQTSWYPKIAVISCMAWCYIPRYAVISLNVNLWSCLMNIPTFSLHSFVVNHGMAYQQCLCSHFFKYLHTPSDSAVSHAGISIRTTKSPIHICSWVVVLQKEVSLIMWIDKMLSLTVIL